MVVYSIIFVRRLSTVVEELKQCIRTVGMSMNGVPDQLHVGICVHGCIQL